MVDFSIKNLHDKIMSVSLTNVKSAPGSSSNSLLLLVSNNDCKSKLILNEKYFMERNHFL